MHKTDALCLLGGHGTPEQDHVERPRLADQPRQPLSSAVARNKAELNLRKTQLSATNCYSESAGQGEFEAATEGKAVDCCDRGKWQPIELRESGLPEFGAALPISHGATAQFLDIGTGTKGLVSSTSNNYGAHLPRSHFIDGFRDIAQDGK